jgi:hypothetical protein
MHISRALSGDERRVESDAVIAFLNKLFEFVCVGCFVNIREIALKIERLGSTLRPNWICAFVKIMNRPSSDKQ